MSWERFKEVITQCPFYDIHNIILIDCFNRGLGPQTKRLVDQFILASTARQPYQMVVQLIDNMDKVIQDVEKYFTIAI